MSLKDFMRSIKALRLRAYAEELKYAEFPVESGSGVTYPFGVEGNLPLAVFLRLWLLKNGDMIGGVEEGWGRTEESLRGQFPSYIHCA
jgi:hypothetical protein